MSSKINKNKGTENSFKLILAIVVIISQLTFSTMPLIKKEKGIMKEKKEEEIPATEDLMREHGILNRILLIYEEIIYRMNKDDFQSKALEKAVTIIQEFIENYHEKLEEDHIFPLFEAKKKQVRLIATLRKQHIKGRAITKQLNNILQSADQFISSTTKKTVKNLLAAFIRMYRPHEAREDTVLFPQVRSLLSEKKFNEMSEQFEAREHELFGQEGFFGIVKRVEEIEKELGIYKLEQFTPEITK